MFVRVILFAFRNAARGRDGTTLLQAHGLAAMSSSMQNIAW